MKDKHHPEFFDWQGIHIYQNEVVHKVGTDAVLLGSWVANIISDPEFILDAGTGCGILALMMAKRFPFSNIHAIDIDSDAVELTRKNVVASAYEKRITIECNSVLDINIQTANLFDLILSNPPFYTEHIRSALEFKRRAKHIIGSEADWIRSLVKRLSTEGHLCLVVPYDAAKTWIHVANEYGYYNLHRLDVFSFASDPFPKRSLLHFTPYLKRPVIEVLSIYKAENKYSQEYLSLTGIRAKT